MCHYYITVQKNTENRLYGDWNSASYRNKLNLQKKQPGGLYEEILIQLMRFVDSFCKYEYKKCIEKNRHYSEANRN